MTEPCVIVKEEKMEHSEQEQQTRAVLREKFLRCVSSISGQYCEMKNVEGQDVTGIYHGMDIHVQNIFLKDLNTPYSHLKNGLIRTQDILYVKFPDIGISPKCKKECDEPMVS